MSWHHLSDTPCKARKPHSCMVCDGHIQPGEAQVVRRGIDGDGPLSFHMHPECKEYSSDWKEWDWECCTGGISRAEVIAALKERPQPAAAQPHGGEDENS